MEKAGGNFSGLLPYSAGGSASANKADVDCGGDSGLEWIEADGILA